MNSPKDDFGYYRDSETNKGFFSSNRDGGLGSDDIYRFISKEKCRQILKGTISDNAAGESLAGVQMVLLNKKHKVIGETTTDASGNYSFNIDFGKTYSLRATKEDYTSEEVTIKIHEITSQTTVDLQLETRICKVTVGDDLGKCFGIKMIYFDLDKSYIRNEAALDLAKILDVLQQNPTMKIHIRSHTDCRQTTKYNKPLSERRVQSTIAWLVSKGIDKSRLTAKGYGESQLINDCDCAPTNKSNCAEEEHQINRRSEFVVKAL